MTVENAKQSLQSLMNVAKELSASLEKASKKVALVQAYSDGKLSFDDMKKQVNTLDE